MNTQYIIITCVNGRARFAQSWNLDEPLQGAPVWLVACAVQLQAVQTFATASTYLYERKGETFRAIHTANARPSDTIPHELTREEMQAALDLLRSGIVL